MSLHPQKDFAIPKQTIQVAHAAFPKGNIYMQMRDELGAIYEDELFEDLYPERGQPAMAPWKLALITVMQFAENLTDRQAADAVRARIDWKYALSLELDDPGFDFSVLSEFRKRLLDGGEEALLFEHMLELFKARQLLKTGGKQRTDSTHVIAAVRELNRLEVVGETLYHLLNVVAQVDPSWLKAQVTPEWFERYGSRFSSFRLPRGKTKRTQLAQTVGEDGWHLLNQIFDEAAPSYLRQLPALVTMQRVWIQHYQIVEGQLLWREKKNVPPAAIMIASPYDTEVRYSQKRGYGWRGYKVHLTEICDTKRPHLITNVHTTASTDQDSCELTAIHEELARKEVLPEEHLVDRAYTSTDLIIDAKERYDIDLVGPHPADQSWQARSGGYTMSQFEIDWENKTATCPEGRKSRYWKPWTKQKHRPMVKIWFHEKDCLACTARSVCTRRKNGARELTLYDQAYHETQQKAREETEEFKEVYALRAGAEGTISQAVVALGARRSRYRGQLKTHFHHLATATAINLKRVMDWINDVPRSKTYQSHFMRLAVA